MDAFVAVASAKYTAPVKLPPDEEMTALLPLMNVMVTPAPARMLERKKFVGALTVKLVEFTMTEYCGGAAKIGDRRLHRIKIRHLDTILKVRLDLV